MSAPSRVTSNILTATSDPALLERLKQMLQQSERADFAVGYLFMSGFHEVADELEGRKQVRVLVGRTDRPTLEAVATGLQQTEALRARLEGHTSVRRSDREAQAAAAVATIGEGVGRLPQQERTERDVRRLRDLVQRGTLEIKTYPRGLLHAKAYICWYPAERDAVGSAIVGSSNFTLAGFTGNTELNVRLQDDHDVCALGEWFDALWADAVDISQDVLVELNRSWPLAQTPPFHVYLKALYELYHDELGLPPIEPPKRGVDLANFQMDAVRQGLAMIDRHGGCFVGDVVGLGKTYIGAELLRQIQLTEPPGRHPLIICPAGLIPMWQRFNEQFGLGAEIVSMSAIRPPGAMQFDEERGEFIETDSNQPGIDLAEKYPHRGAVLVDEVHNFRDSGARRYRALSEYLWSGDHKVVLLSATPQNLGPRDIYNELRLFLDETDHGLPIEPVRLQDYFAAVQRWYEYSVELENWKLDYERWQLERQRGGKARREPPPAQPSQPDAPYATIDQVLNPVFIRRRRQDIRELYGDDARINGRPVKFPDPKLHNLEYRLDRVYERALPFEELQRQLQAFSGARYRAVDYLRPEVLGEERYRDLRRARTRVATLTRFLLVKRLESSVEAFRSTLGVLIQSNRRFRAALTEGYVPVGRTATAILAGSEFDVDDLLARLQHEETVRRASGSPRDTMVHRVADFDIEAWMRDLDADHVVLRDLLARLERVTPEHDDKLQQLRSFLARPEVSAGKVLIFSEAEATIDYLYEQLNPDGADPSIAKLSGSNHDSIQTVVKRFAPKANLRPGERIPGPEVRILLATDVVSEGQNMQDCNRVLNYDLHWNPVRLIQRFGRVDRIGTEHERIHLHNTWPDTNVDQELDLTKRLLDRIQAFHDMIGLDSPLLSQNERINPRGMYAIYEERRVPGEDGDDLLDDVAAHQRGVALLQQIEQNDPDLWSLLTTLPDGIRSTLTVQPVKRQAGLERFLQVANEIPVQAPLTDDLPMQIPLTSAIEEVGIGTPMDAPAPGETVVLLEQGGSSMAYAVGEDLQPRHITPTQLLHAITCEPDEPVRPLPPSTNRRVMAAFEQARLDAEARLGKDRKPGSDTRLRRYLTRQLRRLREQYRGNDVELARIGILQQVFADSLPPRVMEAVEDMRRAGLEGDSLMRRLEALRDLYRLAPPDEDVEVRSDAGVLRIVCSDGLEPPL